MKSLLSILTFLFVSVLIYFGGALGLIAFGRQGAGDSEEPGLSFRELVADDSGLPPLEPYPARDGATLWYRAYGDPCDKVLVLLHGSGWHSRYFLPLAAFLSSRGVARVYTPDLRGHGPKTRRRGDVDSFHRLEDDLADLVAFVRQENPDAVLVVGGHSSGGGLAIRFAGSRHGGLADAFLLLSPFLKYNAPTMRPESGGWARPHVPRIIGLTLLNNVGIHALDSLTAIEFNLPERFRDGTETLAYSHRLNTALTPRNYKTDLRAVTQPLLVVAGTADEAFLADRFEPAISPYAAARFELLPGVTHMGVVVGPEVRPVVRDWINGRGRPGSEDPEGSG